MTTETSSVIRETVTTVIEFEQAMRAIIATATSTHPRGAQGALLEVLRIARVAMNSEALELPKLGTMERLIRADTEIASLIRTNQELQALVVQATHEKKDELEALEQKHLEDLKANDRLLFDEKGIVIAR